MADRELLKTGNSKRFVRRDARGRFSTDQVEIGRSVTKDRQTKTETAPASATADRGDRRSS
jgi:hypothetical protein